MLTFIFKLFSNYFLFVLFSPNLSAIIAADKTNKINNTMKTLILVLICAAIVFIAGLIGCAVGELILKTFKNFFKI